MTKPTIRTVLGPDIFARLKERNLHTLAGISSIAPEELMGIAGIGPQKTVELYKLVGRHLNPDDVARSYRRLKFRTGLKNIRQTFEDPRPTISKIESVREQAMAWQNLANALGNIGKSEGQKRPVTPYVPVTQVLDPYSLTSDRPAADNIYAELMLTQEANKVRLHYEAKDLDNQEVVATSNDFVTNKDSSTMAAEMRDIIKRIYNQFREKTVIGQFFVIFDDKLGSYFIPVSDAFKTELHNRQMEFIPNYQEYLSFEAIYRYLGNPDFEQMVDRYNRYKLYFDYDKYLVAGGRDLFEVWFNKEKHMPFWDVVSQNRKSFDVIETNAFRITFGVLKGMSGLENYEKDFKQVPTVIPFIRDAGYGSYVAAKADVNVAAGLPSVVAAMVHAALDNFVPLKKGNDYIFRSTQLPEIGIHYEAR